ncbi:MAG: putative Ig domain-containing protein [Oligoflexia bacterium]
MIQPRLFMRRANGVSSTQKFSAATGLAVSLVLGGCALSVDALDPTALLDKVTTLPAPGTPVITPSSVSATTTINQALSSIVFSNTGFEIVLCEVTPALPAGVSIDPLTCEISGTPSALQASTTYTITATGESGSDSETVTITVNDIIPVISFSPSTLTGTRNSAITTQTPTNTGGAIISCVATPALPTGLSLNQTTCAISGTPSVTQAATVHSIAATNSGGTASANFTLTVQDALPSITYSSGTLAATLDTAISTQNVTNTGGAIVSCGVSPSLPAGLSFNTSTCAITGTPTALQSSVTYTITATNGTGNASTTLAISVSCAAPVQDLTVTALFSAGSNWNDYVRTADTTTACTGTEAGGVTACVHGGEMRRVSLTGTPSCTGLTLTDSLGAFDWQCNDNGASDAYFFSTGLKQGKGLADLINPSTGAAFAANSVSVTHISSGCTLRTSASSTAWWSNTVQELPNLSSGVAAQALSSSGRIYTLKSSGTTNGYNLNADKIALVTLGSATLGYHSATGANCTEAGELDTASGPYRAIVCAGSQKFTWIEGRFDGDSGLGQAAGTGIMIAGTGSNSSMNRIHRATVFNFPWNDVSTGGTEPPHGIYAQSTSKLHISQSRVSDIYSLTNWWGSGNSGIGLFFKETNYSLVEDFQSSYAGKWGIALNFSSNNSFRNFRIFNSRLTGIQVSLSSDNAFVGGLVAGAQAGIRLGNTSANNTLHQLTLANHSSSAATALESNPGVFDVYGALSIAGNKAWIGNTTLINNTAGLVFGTMAAGWVFNLAANNANLSSTEHIVLNSDSEGLYFEGKFVIPSARNACSVGLVGARLNNSCEHLTEASGEVFPDPTCDTICSNGGGPQAILPVERNYTSSFVGKSADSENSAESASGTATFASLIGDIWVSFQNDLRGWIRNGTFPSAAILGILTGSDTAALFDFSLLSSETEIRGAETFIEGGDCPSDADPNSLINDSPSYGITGNLQTFLISARELSARSSTTGLPTGDWDGLCEDGETCVYAPNIGAYQGHGTISSGSCSFSDGAVAGVTLRGYSSNGY